MSPRGLRPLASSTRSVASRGRQPGASTQRYGPLLALVGALSCRPQKSSPPPKHVTQIAPPIAGSRPEQATKFGPLPSFEIQEEDFQVTRLKRACLEADIPITNLTLQWIETNKNTAIDPETFSLLCRKGGNSPEATAFWAGLDRCKTLDVNLPLSVADTPGVRTEFRNALRVLCRLRQDEYRQIELRRISDKCGEPTTGGETRTSCDFGYDVDPLVAADCAKLCSMRHRR